MKNFNQHTLVLFFFCLFISACSSYKPDSSQVTLWILSDPQQINPILAADAAGQAIQNNIFQPLMNFDFRTLKLVPVLADSMPLVKRDDKGQMLITMEIRKEAKWDNGSPVTAKDVEFTLKVIKNTTVNDESLRSYYDMVNDIILYPDNPRKFTVVCDYMYMYGPISVGTNTFIIPEYAYDPTHQLQGFTVKQMHDDKNVNNDPKMVAFGKEFNSEKYSRDPKFISGSGAYKLIEWTTGQRIVLEKKKDWWGSSVSGSICFFEANPSKLIYQTVNDMTTALVSLKAGNLDVINYIKPADFGDLAKSEKFTQNFNTYKPVRLGYVFMGINIADPKFADIRTRRAIAHLIDVKRIISDIYYGYAVQTDGPITLMDSMNYNHDIKSYDFNIDSAKMLLAAAGWKDSDGDGILDKQIDGKKTDFTIEYLFNSGNEQRKGAGLMLQDAAAKVGIKVEVKPYDFNVYMDNLKNHKFDMFMSSWSIQPGPQDFTQVFRTTSALNRGSNWVSQGNAASDALIDSIRIEMDENKRAGMYKRLQVMIHNDCGYIFICAPEALMAISKKYSNVYPSSNNPYCWEAGFKTDAGK